MVGTTVRILWRSQNPRTEMLFESRLFPSLWDYLFSESLYRQEQLRFHFAGVSTGPGMVLGTVMFPEEELLRLLGWNLIFVVR